MMPEPSAIDSLGPYRLLRPLGKGGMGAVYLAHDSVLNRQVAIKQLLADENEPGYATLKKRFLREAQSAANLNHANIATIYHIGEQAGQPYIVMEYVDGGSWAEHLRRQGAVAWPVALAAIRDAAAGLAAAHAAGIIHRDMKPGNLMRRRPNESGACLTKIVDFGLARAAMGDGDLTHPGAFVGSPSYVSPEQAGCLKADGRSDIYSLGCTLFALLAGRAPFIADDPAEILEHHRRSPLPELDGVASEPIPAAVEAILRRMTAKTPEERFSSAKNVMDAIDHLPLEAFSVRAASVIRGGTGEPPKKSPVEEKSAFQKSKIENPSPPPHLHPASTSLEKLQRLLEDSRTAGNRLAERDTHISLFHLYSRLNRREDAARAARQALALHLKLARPNAN